MSNYSTLGHNLKRGIFNFCGKLSKELNRPIQKFIFDMVYGLIAAKSCFLTEIARELNENIALDKTVERLSRNLMNFDDAQALKETYFAAVSKNFDENIVLIIDDSDIAKPCSKKLEGLGKVHDGSTGKITDGYWYAGVSALTVCHKQPIPVYSHIYSTSEEEYVSNNTITKVYLMRWRIEEYYKFKKQGFGFEKFLVRSLKSIRNLDLLLTVTIGYMGVLSEKINDNMEVMEVIEASKRLYGLAKFTFYAISDGLASIFAKSYLGIRSFFQRLKPSLQLTLFGCQ